MIGFLLGEGGGGTSTADAVAPAEASAIEHDLANLTGRQTPGVERARRVEPDKDSSFLLLLASESSRLTIEDFRGFVMSAVMSGASDITIQSDQQPRVEVHGRLYKGTRRPWSPSEVSMVLAELFDATNAIAEINGRRILDFAYELNQRDGTKQRFRVNATGIQGMDVQGVEITMRALPSTTPTIEYVSLPPDLVRAMAPPNGIVVVAGATGHGKSTTLAAVIRSHLENVRHPVKIVDFQAPIEFTFRDVLNELEGSSSNFGQSEVGRHIESFAEGVRSALRRKPHIISVGEARDLETIKASLEASLTGHLVYTTTHAGSVVDAMRRLLSVFPAEEREARAYDLASSIRVLMVQQLVPRIDRPGRVPVREYLQFTSEVQQQLFMEPVTRWPHIISRIMREGGVSDDPLKRTFSEELDPLVRKGVVDAMEAFRITGDRIFLPGAAE